MYKKKLLRIAGLALLTWTISGFDSCGNAPQPGTAAGSFPVTTRSTLLFPDGSVAATMGTPNIAVTGNWLKDDANAVGSIKSFALTTDGDGNGFVSSGRINADWSSEVLWLPPCGAQSFATAVFPNVNPIVGIGWECITIESVTTANVSTHFALPTQLPSTITANGPGFVSTNGLPQMTVYGGQTKISTATASTLGTNGSAVFPFPKAANGSALGSGFYGLVFSNHEAAGKLQMVNTSYVVMGSSNSSYTTPWGVAVADVTTFGVIPCPIGQATVTPTGAASVSPSGQAAPVLTPPCHPTSFRFENSYPAVTQYSTNQLSYRGSLIPLGTSPTALALYKITSTNDGDSTTTQPSRAIVTNTGSNTVSIVDLIGRSVTATVAVGSKPTAVAVKSDNSVAWVADYGDGTVKEINLTTNTISRSMNVGVNPASFAYDSVNNVLWVGGLNYIAQLNLGTFTVNATIGVTGEVTSLALSAKQNELVATVVSGGASLPFNSQGYNASSSGAIQEFSTTSLTSTAKPALDSTADAYKAFTMNSTLPNVSLLANGTVVSANYSNSISVSATTTGFTVVDLINHATIMQGATPTPVRSIAVDQAQAVAYLAVPDSNLLISVPLK